MMERETHTWDGVAIAPENPIGAAVLVYRKRAGSDPEFLILRRADVPNEGDWAWTPPSGCRQPGEDIDVAARRELFEETGIDAAPLRTELGSEAFRVYELEFPANGDVILDHEHSEYAWLPVGEVVRRCHPADVSRPIVELVDHLRERRP